ncbi:MAG: glycosyltransferase [Micromonosporaceae bacterium]|nr:glycosyltransferase [Micromonosporaceae bacterium]
MNDESGAAEGAASAAYPGLGRVLVVVPTYNEAENLREISRRLLSAVPAADLLIADDNSPDGTGEIADEIAAADSRVTVLHRPGKQGLGAAYIAGFRWAAEHEYDVVVEMDADGSHAPEELPKLLEAARDADLVIGSRWAPGGKVVNWPAHRLLLSRGANLYTRMALGMPARDATGGYRVYRMPVLEKLDLDAVASQGYCFQVDLTWRAYQEGARVAEVPITFVERAHGRSKMSSSIVREALWRVTVWGARARWRSVRRLLGRR